MGYRPSADVFFGYHFSEDEEVGSEEFECKSSVALVEAVGFEFTETIAYLEGTYSGGTWDGPTELSLPDIPDSDKQLLIEECKRIGLPVGDTEPRWLLVVSYN
jgi:hypothetical protein